MSSLRFKRNAWIVIGIAVLALVAFLVQLLVQSNRVPERLGALSCVQTVTGADARALVNTMHGRAVTPETNIVATYRGDAGEAKLYISVYSSRDSATMITEAMARRIEAGVAPFSHFRAFEKGTKPVYMCLGQGQAHFFFACDVNLYWLAADIGTAEQAIIELRKEVCK